MAIKLVVNGVDVMTESKFEVSRQAIAQIITTKNPLADGVTSALGSIPNGALALVENLSTGNMTDVVEVHEKPQGKEVWTKTHEATRKSIINRFKVALMRDDCAVTVFGEKSEKTVKENVPQETGGF